MRRARYATARAQHLIGAFCWFMVSANGAAPQLARTESSPTNASSPAGMIYVDTAGSDEVGARDTTKAFATVPAALAAAQEGDTIVVRPGSYEWASATLSAADVTILAQGATFTKTTVAANLLTVSAKGFRIFGATFDGNRHRETGGYYTNFLLLLNPGSDAVIEQCRFINNAGAAIGIVNPTTENVRVRRNYFYSNSQDIRIDNAKRCRLENNFHAGCINADPHSGGVKIDATAGGIAADHIVTGNTIHGPAEMGIEFFRNSHGCRAVENHIFDTSFGISVGIVDRSSTAGNWIKGATYAGIEHALGSNGSSSGDFIDGRNAAGANVMQQGYSVDQATNVSITGGSVVNAAARAIFVTASREVSISGVNMDSVGADGVYIVDSPGTSVNGCTIRGSSDHAVQCFNTGDSAAIGPKITNNTIFGYRAHAVVGVFNTGAGGVNGSVVADNYTESAAPRWGFLRTSGTVTGTQVYGNSQNDPANVSGFANASAPSTFTAARACNPHGD